MESELDLFGLPTFAESSDDPNFNYPGYYCDPFLWRIQAFHEALKKYHYDNTYRLRASITEHENRIAQLSKGANAYCRIWQDVRKKEKLIPELQILEAGWKKIAPVLRAESQKLFKLPRELRDVIYGYLYTRQHNIGLDLPDIDVRRSMLPRDRVFYLNAALVHPQIAAEAALVLYNTNSFVLRDRLYWNENNFLSQFLRTDHFGSGILPKDIIRRLSITMNFTLSIDAPPPVAYENEHCRNEDGHNRTNTDRSRLASVLEMKQLQLLHIKLGNNFVTDSSDLKIEYRGLAPIIRMLKQRGVAVRVTIGLAEFTHLEGEENGVDWKYREVDVSEMFDELKELDLQASHQLMGAEMESPEGRTFEEKLLGSRVQIWVHGPVFEAKELEEKTGMLQRAKARIDAISAALESLKGTR